MSVSDNNTIDELIFSDIKKAVNELPRSQLKGYRSRWWFFTVQFKSKKDAKKWSPEKIGSVKYAAYRSHLAPTTGKPHVHCLVNFSTPVRDTTLAKTKGVDGRCLQFFENKSRNGRGSEIHKYFCFQYVKNDRPDDDENILDELKEIGKRPACLDNIPKSKGPSKSELTYMNARESGNVDTAKKIIAEGAFRDMAINGDKIDRNLRDYFNQRIKTSEDPKFKREDFELIPYELDYWADNELKNPDRPLLLILEGPSRSGKTEWAKSLVKNFVYIQSNTNIDTLDDNADLLIFDDIDWSIYKDRLEQLKSLFGAKGHCNLTDRYRPKSHHVIKCPSIVLCNSPPFFYTMDSKYWDENCLYIKLSGKLSKNVPDVPTVNLKRKLEEYKKTWEENKRKKTSSETNIESEPTIIEISEDQKEDIIEYRRTHNISKKMSNIEVLERIEADKLLDNRAEQCVEHSKSFEYELPSEDELRKRGIRIVK